MEKYAENFCKKALFSDSGQNWANKYSDRPTNKKTGPLLKKRPGWLG